VLLEAAEIVVERVAAEVTEADAAGLLTAAAVVVVVVVTEVAEEEDIQIAAVIAADEVEEEEEVLTEVEVVEDSEEDVEVDHQRESTSKSSVLWVLAIWLRYQSFFHLLLGSCLYFYSLSAFAWSCYHARLIDHYLTIV
jgi:hypothetical protein